MIIPVFLGIITLKKCSTTTGNSSSGVSAWVPSAAEGVLSKPGIYSDESESVCSP
jgi:hypothetical protein